MQCVCNRSGNVLWIFDCTKMAFQDGAVRNRHHLFRVIFRWVYSNIDIVLRSSNSDFLFTPRGSLITFWRHLKTHPFDFGVSSIAGTIQWLDPYLTLPFTKGVRLPLPQSLSSHLVEVVPWQVSCCVLWCSSYSNWREFYGKLCQFLSLFWIMLLSNRHGVICVE